MNLFNPQKRLTFPADDPALVNALQVQSRALLTAHNDRRYADRWAIFKALVLATVWLSCYLIALGAQAKWVFALAYLAMMLFAMLLAVNVVHDASHNAFVRGKRANARLSFLAALPLGMDADSWRVRHVRFHHGFTNIECYDPDTAENGLLRQTPWQRWRPFMRVQRFYWPLVAGLTFPWYIWVVDWLDRCGLTPVTPHLAWHGVVGWSRFLVSKAVHLILTLVLPLWLLADRLGVLTVLGTYVVSQLIASLIFVMLIIGTHWAKGYSQLPPSTGRMTQGRIAHTFATTFDWRPTPAWLGYWLGGINLHLTHHLFPHWHHRHYPALCRIIADIAQQQGMDYSVLTLRDLLSLQQHFLRQMGQPPERDTP